MTKFSRLFIYPIAIVLAVLPICFISLGARADILPNLALGILYFCAVQHLASYSLAFIYGLFLSEVYGYPPGLESFLFVVIYVICARYRMTLLSKQPLSIYLGFAIIDVVYGVSKYIILSLYYGHLFDSPKAAMQILTTMLFYPALNLALEKLK